MSLFDAFKKINEALAKAPSNSHPPEQKSATPASRLTPPKQRYKRIVKWLKMTYGERFEGASTEEIEKQLTKILKEDIEPNFRTEPKYIKGFKNYIAEKQYGDLVRVE
jgi:hypothetical protein